MNNKSSIQGPGRRPRHPRAVIVAGEAGEPKRQIYGRLREQFSEWGGCSVIDPDLRLQKERRKAGTGLVENLGDEILRRADLRLQRAINESRNVILGALLQDPISALELIRTLHDQNYRVRIVAVCSPTADNLVASRSLIATLRALAVEGTVETIDVMAPEGHVLARARRGDDLSNTALQRLFGIEITPPSPPPTQRPDLRGIKLIRAPNSPPPAIVKDAPATVAIVPTPDDKEEGFVRFRALKDKLRAWSEAGP